MNRPRVYRKRLPRAGREKGFTLLEVLVALAILGIVLGALLPVFTGAIGRQKSLAEMRSAIALAESGLASVGTELPLNDGVTEGAFSNGFGWRLEIAPFSTNAPDTQLSMKLATLTVSWPKPNGEHSLTLKALRLGGRR